MRRKIAGIVIVLLLVSSGCTGNDPGKMFFDARVVNSAPENTTTISYNHSDVAENDELRSIIRETVQGYKMGGNGDRATAASPRAVAQLQELPTAYIVYRNETVKVTTYMQS